MTKLSMNEVTTFRWSLEQDIENYEQAGYRSIGLWRHKLSDWDEDQAIDWLSASPLNVASLSWAGGFTGSEGRTLAEAIDDAIDAVRMSAALGAGCLVVYPGGRNNHTFRHAGRLLRTALDQILPLAEALSVPLAIEPIHPACASEWTFLVDLVNVLELIDEYRCDALKLAYDTYYFTTQEELDLLSANTQHIGIVHLGDRRLPPSVEQDRCPLGCGLLPLREIVTSLQQAGYGGLFDVKLLGIEIENCDYWTLLKHSRTAFASLATPDVSRSLA